MRRSRLNFGPRLDPPVRICDDPDCGEMGSCTEPLTGAFCARHAPLSYWPTGKRPVPASGAHGASLWPESEDERRKLIRRWREEIAAHQGKAST